MPRQDPVMALLLEIREKQDQTIKNQERMDGQLQQIHADCRRTAMVAGAASGGVMGGIVTTGILMIKAKFGL
ncbi:MAG: hypothetical protein Q4A62_00325 [Eikenella sp.]|uniref:Uncharacterized protein n=2 Tax=Neisseria shayeganii TaxID=607712 RepID=A0A7D7S9K0_9NEIS|nr:hypothetical protein [Neisseria shayeganii]MDO4693062.1 hypothetical protein [Eikenella sp.]QMT41651.1 hypothetical protein H3L94_09005 [Neisseria shayeganii]